MMRPSGLVTTNPSGAFCTSDSSVDLALAATTAPASASSGISRIRNSEALSCRNSEAETSSSRRPSIRQARALSARPVARTLASSERTAGVLSTSNPSGNERPTTRRTLSPSSCPAAGFASTTFCEVASTIITASEVTWNSRR